MWKFKVDDGSWQTVGLDELNYLRNKLYPETTMHIATFGWFSNPLSSFSDFEYNANNAGKEADYCAKDVDNFNHVSNTAFCGDDKREDNIGFYYEIVFPVKYDNLMFCF
jgi:hypothetical protein